MKRVYRFIAMLTMFSLLCGVMPAMAEEEGIAWPVNYGLDGRESPFRPPQKYITQQNPPDFSWPMVSGASAHEVIVCRDEAMTDIAYSKSGIALNFYNFTEPFEIGTYYWAVRYKLGTKYSVWTEPRRFRIDPDAWEYVVPDIEEILQRVPKTHPRVWATQDNLAEFRAFAETETGKKIIDNCEKQVRTAMQSPLPPEPAPVTETDPVKKSLIHSQMGRDVDKMYQIIKNAAMVYLTRGDREIGQFGVKAVLALAGWDTEGPTSYKNQDQLHRSVTMNAAMGVDWFYDLMSDQERSTVLKMVQTRTNTMAYLLDSLNTSPYDSHGFTAFGFIGIIAVATMGEIPEAEDWLRKIIPRYANVLPPWSNEDGGWSQGIGYWQYSSAAWKDLAIVLQRAGIFDLHQKAYARNEMYFPIYMLPKGSIGVFGDESYIPPTNFSVEILSYIADQYRDGYAKWAYEEIAPVQQDIKLLLKPHLDEIEAKKPTSWPRSKQFKDVGQAALHSDLIDPNRVSLYFRSSQYGSFNHAHADQNSFAIQAYGERLAIDSGYYDAYYSAHDLGYTRKTYAHNAITTDGGNGQVNGSMNAKGKFIDFLNHPDFDLISGDASESYERLDKAVRHIIYVRPDAYVVIDDLKSNKPGGSVFEWWLNAQEDISLYEEGNGARIVQGKAVLDAKVQYPAKVEGYYSNIFSGPDLVHIPAKGNFTNSPVQKRVWFETEKMSQTKMVTTLDVHTKNDPAQYIKQVDHGSYMELQFEDGTVVLANLTDGPVIAGNIEFDGAAVVYNDETIMLASGKRLVKDGKVLAESERICSVVMGKDELGVSIEDDNTVTIGKGNEYISEITAITDKKGRELTPSIGVTPDNQADKLILVMDKDDYAFVLNSKPMPGERGQDVTVHLTLDGVSRDLTYESYVDADGNLVMNGTLPIESGRYKLQTLTKGLTLNNMVAGEIATLSKDMTITAIGGTEYSVTLVTIPVVDCKAEVVEDQAAAKASANIFIEAENMTKNVGGAAVYSTRQFMSGGAGLTTLNSPADEVTYTIRVDEAGTYDFLMCYVAWLTDIDTVKTISLGDFYGRYVCPITAGWGSEESEWRTMRIGTGVYLEPGEYEFKLGSITGSWNVDWIGLVKN